MKYSSTILITTFAASIIFAHGVIDDFQGVNSVNMPGISDGTSHDCANPSCGSEAETAIIPNRELGTQKSSALGRNQSGGSIDASKMINMIMNGGSNEKKTKEARAVHATNVFRRSLGERAINHGTKTPEGSLEFGFKAAAGSGSSSGMPTCADDGTVKMIYHQVNQDGAGPLMAMMDGTSGGTDPAAFKKAQVIKNVPGIGIGRLSTAGVTDFLVEVQMPAGMTCDGTVEDQKNVCVMMLKNAAAAGPFGGSVAFVQSPAAKKRAIEYRLRKRNFARILVRRGQQDDMATELASLEAKGSATKAEDSVEDKHDVLINKQSNVKKRTENEYVTGIRQMLEDERSKTDSENGDKGYGHSKNAGSSNVKKRTENEYVTGIRQMLEDERSKTDSENGDKGYGHSKNAGSSNVKKRTENEYVTGIRQMLEDERSKTDSENGDKGYGNSSNAGPLNGGNNEDNEDENND